MSRLLLTVILCSFYFLASGQQTVLVFKKGKKPVHRFWSGQFIAFQLSNKQWEKGELTRITPDSFYIRPRIVRYNLMNTDTFYYNIKGFSKTDIYAMPNTGILIDYVDGRFQVTGDGGHVHFYWIKSGWLFRTGAIGYTGLHLVNGLLKNDLRFSESKKPLLIAGSVFLGGVLLHKHYKPYLRIGKKYKIETLDLSAPH